MRTIKFRGKSDFTDKFIFGDLVRNLDGRLAIIPPFKNGMDNHCEKYGVDPNTLGQFTGLKDKNGIEIYEGDIIEHYNCHQDWETGEIEFKLEQFIVKFEEGSFGVYRTIPDAKYLSEILGCEVSELSEEELEYVGLKVIGNIYDTPELIDE